MYKIRIGKIYCWTFILMGKTWRFVLSKNTFTIYLANGCGYYVLSIRIRDSEIIQNPSSKESIDYEGRQTKVSLLI